LNKVGSDTPVKDITPAEAMLLHILHGTQNGGMTFGKEFEDIKIHGTAMVDTGKKDAANKPVLRSRTDAEELRRLGAKYNGARDKTNKPIIDTVWPDKLNPKLPQTFKEIEWADVAGAAAGVETAAINYATGALATAALPTK